MTFNSWQFLLFLPLVVVVHWLLPHRFRWIWLLCASYFFYMFWNPSLAILLFFTSLVSYFCGLLIQKDPAHKKAYLALTLVISLGSLIAFKYLNFLLSSFIGLMGLFTVKISPITLNLILPVGISFYTFQTLSYVIDVYRGKIAPERHFGYYALFVSFFPQLVAGPIEMSDILLPQLRQERHLTQDDAFIGLRHLLFGFVLKCAIADFTGIFVNQVFADLSHANSLAIFGAAFLFCIEMYCDFNGYSEIAIGSARLLGIRLTKNFDEPYLSCSYTEFFRRWHYSLNRWFEDYVYIPLGGNRKGKGRELLNKGIVFALCGLWHGANWTYLFWGMYAGFWVDVESVTINPYAKKKKAEGVDLSKGLIGFLRRVILWLIFIPAALLFRAQDLNEVTLAFRNLFTAFGPDFFLQAFQSLGFTPFRFALLSAFLVVMVLLAKFAYLDEPKAMSPDLSRVGSSSLFKEQEISLFAPSFVLLAFLAILMSILLLANNQVSSFAYFQF